MNIEPTTMRAFVLTGHGDMEKLVFHADWPTPVPKPGTVLVKVHACGLNNTDVNTRTAWYSKEVRERTTGGGFERAGDDDATWSGASIEFPRIQGADVAGEVVGVGDGSDESLIGKRVLIDPWLRDWNHPDDLNRCGYFGSETDGGFADFTCIDQRNVHPIDSPLSNPELATFATSYVTAENMLNRANVSADDVVLITGASGGVGSALIQLANRRAAKTIAMASETKHDQVRAIGPDAILSRTPEDLKTALLHAAGRGDVSVVMDVVGGDYWPKLIDVLVRGGRCICSGAIAGPMVNVDLRTFYLHDLTFRGASIPAPHTFGDLVGYVSRGEIRPILAEAFPLERLHEAQRAFIDKRHAGNIVVTMDN